MSNKQMDKYNTAVRRAMSEKYVECTKKKCEIRRKIHGLYSLLHSDEGKNLSYGQYRKLEEDLDYYEREHARLRIELNIWSEAREICMDLADEMS